MKFSQLLATAGCRPRTCRGDAEITSVQSDSRLCSAGACFVAVSGSKVDGQQFIPRALAAGASAVVCRDDDQLPDGVPSATVDDAHQALGQLAQAILSWPARKLVNIAVTGTKGKSTTTYLIRSILEAQGFRPALLGTISYETGLRSLPAPNTTPGAVALAALTAEMVSVGRTHLVMEVSSHALDQQRTAGLDFGVRVFTNLGQDHIDYHQSRSGYFAAKRRLFEQPSSGAVAVINADDEWGRKLAPLADPGAIWYGLGDGAQLGAVIRKIDFSGTDFDMTFRDKKVPVHSPLVGRHNVYNCLAAAGACLGLGVNLGAVADALEKAGQIPGRLQRVPVAAPYTVLVDYAHTEESLANVLESCRHVNPDGRLILVFGCGGDRDRTKRPRMAAVAERIADDLIITSDNPRTEDPQRILDEVAAGLTDVGRTRARVEIDRRKAIELAVASAGPRDIVLIAGKGHEDYQIFGEAKIHFDDREVAAEAIRRKEGLT